MNCGKHHSGGERESFFLAYTQEQLDVWNRIAEKLRESVSPVSYDAWIKPMRLFAVTSDEIIITSPILQAMGALRGRYESMIEAAVRVNYGMNYRLRLIDPKDAPKEVVTNDTTLNPKYQFENFVVGKANNLAYAASLAVAEQPSDVYNPLFIYGDAGLGKTHLMNAIGNFIKHENPMANVLLTSSEHLTNELIDAIVRKKTADLRSRLRSVDVLMVDDIQFLAKAPSTQEEFFHTFNDLYNNHRQIIISSDRPPNEIPTIEERLRSRFAWGLIVDVQKPDFEHRVAILRKKTDEEYIDIPYDAIEYIASHFDKSIRELEGALNRVNARSQLMGEPITLESTIETLQSLAGARDTRKITPELILGVVARKYDLSTDDLLSSKRSRDIAVPRQIAIYLCRELTELSTTSIGRAFGGRDHTTVLHSCDKIADQVKSDFAFKRTVDELMELVKNS